MLNSVSIMGRLTADPELKTTENGKTVVNFSVATERRFAKTKEERKTDFFEVAAWSSTAEFIVKHFSKGSMIAINGELQTKSYLDKKTDTKRTKVFILTDNVSFCGSKKKTTEPEADEYLNYDPIEETY